MTKYLFKRILYGIFSVIAVVAIVMIMIYGLLDRNRVFAGDPVFNRQVSNQRTVYKYSKWEEYGYLDYVPYTDYLKDLYKQGVIDEDTRASAAALGRTADKDSELTAEYVQKFYEYYSSQGYTVVRLDAQMSKRKVATGGQQYSSQGYTVVRLDAQMSKRKVATGGQQQYFAFRDIPLAKRMLTYFTGLFTIDNIHTIESDVGERGLSFTLYDPAYGGDKFSPAIMGNGTMHKYLVYCDSRFPYIHQNILQLNLGTSYTVNTGVDVFTTMTRAQGSYVKSMITYPTGLEEMSADDLHTATYQEGSLASNLVYADRFTDDYTRVDTVKAGLSKMGYSFVIGIISTIISYVLGIPLGIMMARKKDKLIDKLGTIYIVFMIAVPSLAYIFLFKSIGGKLGLPTTFDMESSSKLMFILPIVSLALPSIANLMKWLRRYMIDQMNADYVKFARSNGLSEGEIFRKHILKNAAIPIIHGIPGSVLFAMTGAIITERVYVVPGAGNLLTEAINKYDNGVIVGVALFYAVLSVVSIILGDILMSMVDPRISFTNKDR